MGYWDSPGKALSWAAGTVLLCAVPLLAESSGTTHASTAAVATRRPPPRPNAPRVPSPAVSPAAASPAVPSSVTPPATVTTAGETLYSGSGLTVTLTTMVVRGNKVTAHVSYQNVGPSALGLYCSGVTDPAIDTLTSANGTVIPATNTYCSDHATAAMDLPPGGTLRSYAIFKGVQASAGPFTLTWQEGQPLSGSVSGITFG